MILGWISVIMLVILILYCLYSNAKYENDEVNRIVILTAMAEKENKTIDKVRQIQIELMELQKKYIKLAAAVDQIGKTGSKKQGSSEMDGQTGSRVWITSNKQGYI